MNPIEDETWCTIQPKVSVVWQYIEFNEREAKTDLVHTHSKVSPNNLK